MPTYKSPLEQANALIGNDKPNDYAFDTRIISRQPLVTPLKDRWDGYRLVRMTGDDYYKLVANEINHKWQDLEKQRRETPNELSVDEMAEKMRKGEKFPTPWVHLNDKLGTIPHFQEGLHRMLAAKDVYGDKARFPVYLGYNKEESWDDLEDALDKNTLDDWIQKRNAKILQNQIDYDNDEWDKEQERIRQDKIEAARWFGLSGIDNPEDVDEETLNRFYKELDDYFQEKY